ncbi:MAG: 2OG-Fe(II) oxygenase [Alishewanella aestuarii]
MTTALITDALQDIYYGRPLDEGRLIEYALGHKSFAEAWLVHVLASDASKRELACCLVLCHLHHSAYLSEIEHNWPLQPVDPEHWFEFVAALTPELANKLSYSAPLLQLWLSLLAMPLAEPVLASPQVEIIQVGQLSALLQNVITHGRQALTKANVYAPDQLHKQITTVRNNLQHICTLPNQSLHAALLQRAMAGSDRSCLRYAEPLVIYQYLPGQEYKWHCDYILPANSQAQAELDFFGQRTHTKIIYLNSDFSGGATQFKQWQLTAQCKAGDLISFANLTAKGEPNPESVHCGAKVVSGEKWISTLWFRQKPNWLRAPLFSDAGRAS